MKRLTQVLVGLALMAVFAISAVLPVPAFGAIELLNNQETQTEKLKFSGTAKTTTTFTKLKGFGVTKCPELGTEGELAGKGLLGLFHFHWKGCTTNLGGMCTGLGDEAGLILALGTFHLVFDSLTTLGLGMLFLLEHVHYTCKVPVLGDILVLVLGEVLCLITPINAKTKTIKATCEGAKGDPKETVYWNEKGEEVKMGENALLGSENEKAFEMSAEDGVGEATASEEVELMA